MWKRQFVAVEKDKPRLDSVRAPSREAGPHPAPLAAVPHALKSRRNLPLYSHIRQKWNGEKMKAFLTLIAALLLAGCAQLHQGGVDKQNYVIPIYHKDF